MLTVQNIIDSLRSDLAYTVRLHESRRRSQASAVELRDLERKIERLQQDIDNQLTLSPAEMYDTSAA